MIRYSEQDFINEIRTMVSNNASEQEISYRALELMNSSIDWREEFRDSALDLISIIEPGFYMTNDEILELSLIHICGAFNLNGIDPFTIAKNGDFITNFEDFIHFV